VSALTEETSEELNQEISPNIATPIQPIETINRVVAVLYTYKRPVMYKDIAQACDMHPVNVSQSLSSARDIGLTQLAGKKGLYTTTEFGKEYARLLSFGKGEEASKVLRIILQSNPLWREILTFLQATRGQSRNPADLILEVERRTGKQWKSSMRSRIEDSLVSILEFARLVGREGSNIISLAEPDPQLPLPRPEPEATTPTKATSSAKQFVRLTSDEFTFEIREDLDTIDFADSQFQAWINYLRKKLKAKQEAQQNEGVPNQ
jgi:hypothetical protein